MAQWVIQKDFVANGVNFRRKLSKSRTKRAKKLRHLSRYYALNVGLVICRRRALHTKRPATGVPRSRAQHNSSEHYFTFALISGALAETATELGTRAMTDALESTPPEENDSLAVGCIDNADTFALDVWHDPHILYTARTQLVVCV